jgi:HK97 gp10 family phage protein
MAKRSKMTGAKNIARSMNQLAPRLNAPLNRAGVKALRPMRDLAKQNLKANGNVESGELVSLISVKRDPRARKDRPRLMVGPDAKKGPGYRKAHLVEFGTAPHEVDGWFHPGARAFPFLRPAFEETKDTTIAILGKEVGPEIEKEMARIAKRAKK